MHEAMVAQNLLSAIIAEATKQGCRPIGAKISCCKLYAINDEALCFAFEALAKDTICEQVKLEIEHRPPRGRCKACGAEFDIEMTEVKCPRCGRADLELLPDAGLLLEQIEFDTE